MHLDVYAMKSQPVFRVQSSITYRGVKQCTMDMWRTLTCARSSDSRYATLLSTPGAMHTTPPRPEPAPSPTSTCQWKWGRPVIAGSPGIRRMHHMPGPNAHSPLNQATANEAAATTEDKGRPLPASAALHVSSSPCDFI